MNPNNDELPDSEVPAEPSNTRRKQAFTFGGDADPDPVAPEADEEDEEPRLGLDGQELEPLPVAPLTPAPEAAFEPKLAEPLDTINLQAAAELAMKDPALQRISAIGQERFLTKKPRIEANAKVTRGWLESLDQRNFFLAIGYPGNKLHQMLDLNASLGQIRSWVDGLELIPPLLRRVLMLEHILDRRTAANRLLMPSRQQIEDALRVMPKTGSVSEVLGGFDHINPRDLLRHPTSPQIREGTTGEVRQLISVVRPGQKAADKPRQGSALPLNARLRGRGRQLGVRLLKANPYCYSISKKSLDEMGVPRISIQQAIDLVNKCADLEVEFGELYSMRRRDTKQPWMVSNIEFLPTAELERQRGAHLRRSRDEE